MKRFVLIMLSAFVVFMLIACSAEVADSGNTGLKAENAALKEQLAALEGR